MEEDESRHELTIMEKKMVVKCYTFLEKYQKEECFAGTRTRKLVEDCIGVKEATVARVMKAYKENAEAVFQDKQSNRGRHRAYSVEEISPTIRSFVEEQNKKALPITAQLICNEFEAKHGVTIQPRSMALLMTELGYSYVVGEKRHIFMESPGNVALRNSYLAKKLANRVTTIGRNGEIYSGVKRPEVYLDESFCNVHHVSGKTWLTADKVRYAKSGKGARACIIAAGIIRTQGAVTMGEFVRGSKEVWNSTLKRKHWEPDDYHGNFDAPKFERWFENLCQILQQSYGGCNIHMDGASYHKRQTNKAPTMSDRRAEIIAWLRSNVNLDIDFTQVKKNLIEIVDAHRPKPIYCAQTLATKYGHLLYFTPPYHPTLQPIELIWAQVKDPIARSPATNATETVAKGVEDSFVQAAQLTEAATSQESAAVSTSIDDE